MPSIEGSSGKERNKKAKNTNQQIQLHISQTYEDIRNIIHQKNNLTIQLPPEMLTAAQRVTLMKKIIQYLLQEVTSKQYQEKDSDLNLTNKIQCQDCQCYEKQLQRMEAEVRNHIRTHQQLKIYQDSLEEKIEEQKNQKKQVEKKMQAYKKKYEEMKIQTKQKITKLEQENDKLKQEVRNPRKTNRFQTNKQNCTQHSHRNHSKAKDRFSIQKRVESTQKMRTSMNIRSSKGMPLMNKVNNERGREEKMKMVKSRLGYGF